MKRSLAIAATVFSLMWITSTGVLLFFVASLIGVPFLLLAFVTMDAAFLALLALFLVTNTAISSAPQSRAADPFSMTSEDLKNAVLLADGQAYGRRKHDDTQVVKRLIGKFEDEDALRPAPATTPQWALDLQANGAPDLQEGIE